MLSATNIDGEIEMNGRLLDLEAFEREDRRTQVRAGDVLLTIVGTIGRTAVVPEGLPRFTLQRSVAVIKPYPLNAKFLSYQLRSQALQRLLQTNARGTAQKGIYLKTLGGIEIKVAPLPEQIRIVEMLDRLLSDVDAADMALQRVAVNLKRYRAAVLKAAVEGRLVPTEAERAHKEGREYEHASVLLDRILKERRRRWEESELARMKAAGKPPKDDHWKSKYREPVAPDTTGLPPLQEGWCWATVDQVSVDSRYGSSAKAQPDLPGVPVLRMGNIVDGTIDFTDLKYLPLDHSEFPDLLLKSGDILFNRTNSAELVGKSSVFKDRSGPWSFASYLIRVRLSELCSPDYVSFFLNSFHGRKWIASVVSQQVGQANVNGSKLRRCVIPLPPEKEQFRILAEVERITSVIFEAGRSVTHDLYRCDRLRQSILKRAFEGKLVDQDPSDEPASVLLERIRTERAASAPPRKFRNSFDREAGSLE